MNKQDLEATISRVSGRIKDSEQEIVLLEAQIKQHTTIKSYYQDRLVELLEQQEASK
jgi:hypothetical protein